MYSGEQVLDGRVQVTVTNTGAYDSDEVVQVYSHNSLTAFRRISLRKGESKTVIFPINSAMRDEILVGGCGFQKEKLMKIVL